jgi:3-phenylpropionate/trans-cinnamate dioxygenase ferredoxin reductase subunit
MSGRAALAAEAGHELPGMLRRMTMETKHDYLIVGAGPAGSAAIEGIRERDGSGTILMIGREPELPYDRPPLSKQLWFGKKKLPDIYYHDESWYAANGVDLLLDRGATRVEVEGRVVSGDRGDRHHYRKLLLATGGQPRRLEIPGGDLEGVCYFRTVDDFRRLRKAAQEGSSAVVIGGSFIGSEMAAGLAHAGLTVTMVFPDSYLGHRVFPPSLGRFLQQQYGERGIRVLAGDAPATIATRGERFLTTTRGGETLDSDLVVAGIGIRPSLELASSAGLTIADGIVVDEQLRTSSPDIYAAGDVALFPYAALGGSRRVEHWDNARTQGKHAGRNLAGGAEPYLHMPYFFSDLFDFGYEAVGEIDARLEIVADWQEENRRGVVYYLSGGRVRGAMMCNVWDKVEAARQLIREGGPTDPEELRGAIGG